MAHRLDVSGGIRPWLEAIAARTVDGTACADWFGPDAGGHFVKMAHNAIEYGVMQAIAEATGHELPANYRTMTAGMRSGDDLPEHLASQLGNPEDH